MATLEPDSERAGLSRANRGRRFALWREGDVRGLSKSGRRRVGLEIWAIAAILMVVWVNAIFLVTRFLN